MAEEGRANICCQLLTWIWSVKRLPVVGYWGKSFSHLLTELLGLITVHKTLLRACPEYLLCAVLHRAAVLNAMENTRMRAGWPALCLQTGSLSIFSAKVVPIALPDLVQIVLELQCLFQSCVFRQYFLAIFPLSFSVCKFTEFFRM